MPDPIRPVFPGLLNAGPQPAQPMFRTLSIAASGLSAQRQRMEVIASNIANAETTRAKGGKPYQRLVAQMAERGTPGAMPSASLPGYPDIGTPGQLDSRVMAPNVEGGPVNGVVVTGVVADTTEGQNVYDPGHPDADKNGYVHMPNVRVTDELVDLMDARRAYEANATVFSSQKSMLRRAIDI